MQCKCVGKTQVVKSWISATGRAFRILYHRIISAIVWFVTRQVGAANFKQKYLLIVRQYLPFGVLSQER